MSKRRPPRLTQAQVAALTAEERRDYCTKYVKWRISHMLRLIGMEAKLRRPMLDEMRIDGLVAGVEIMLLEGRAHGYFDDKLREMREHSRGFDPLLPSHYFDDSMSPPSSAEFAAALLANPKTRSYQLGDRAEQFGCDVLMFGRRRAELLYWRDVVVSAGPLLLTLLKRLALFSIAATLYGRARGL